MYTLQIRFKLYFNIYLERLFEHSLLEFFLLVLLLQWSMNKWDLESFCVYCRWYHYAIYKNCVERSKHAITTIGIFSNLKSIFLVRIDQRAFKRNNRNLISSQTPYLCRNMV